MQNKLRGVMQSPVTPLKDDFGLDLPTFERLVVFHVRARAPAISWPHHKGESLNLTIAERKLFAEAAVKVVAGRVPVTVHVSALAVENTMALARHAQAIGADGILAITPYFWTPTAEAIEAYFVRLCTLIELPVLSCNSPSYLNGVEITGDLMARLIGKLPNFVGVKEASFNSEKFLEISRAAARARLWRCFPARSFWSPHRRSALGMVSALSIIAPTLVRRLFDLCQRQELFEPRAVQEELAALRQIVKPGSVGALKAAARAMGRHCGHQRPPLVPLEATAEKALVAAIAALPAIGSEPRGW